MCRPLIVCGLHRSGTTFVGKILQQVGVVLIHEPLNERFGMSHVPIAYPYVAKRNAKFSGLLDDAVGFSRPWNTDTQYIQSSGLRKLLYAKTGGRSGMRWARLRLQKTFGILPKHICLKDPFMSLATPYLVKQHGLKIVCLIRHPAAIHYSTNKQAWRFDVRNLRKQTELMEDIAFDISNQHWDMAEKHAAASIAVLWKVMLRINQKIASESDMLKLITHENLCTHPVQVAKDIFTHFELPFTPHVEQFVVSHSQGGRVEAKGGKTHDFKRDSKAIPTAWVGKISSTDERMILDIAGEELVTIYGEGHE